MTNTTLICDLNKKSFNRLNGIALYIRYLLRAFWGLFCLLNGTVTALVHIYLGKEEKVFHTLKVYLAGPIISRIFKNKPLILRI